MARIHRAHSTVNPAFDVGIQHVQTPPRHDDPVANFLEGVLMRVTCTALPTGTMYQIYRGSESFGGKIKALVPLLLQVRQNVLIGNTLEDPRLVVTIAPMPGDVADELRQRLGEHLVRPCS